jgi:hypothetical protein
MLADMWAYKWDQVVVDNKMLMDNIEVQKIPKILKLSLPTRHFHEQ